MTRCTADISSDLCTTQNTNAMLKYRLGVQSMSSDQYHCTVYSHRVCNIHTYCTCSQCPLANTQMKMKIQDFCIAPQNCILDETFLTYNLWIYECLMKHLLLLHRSGKYICFTSTFKSDSIVYTRSFEQDIFILFPQTHIHMPKLSVIRTIYMYRIQPGGRARHVHSVGT